MKQIKYVCSLSVVIGIIMFFRCLLVAERTCKLRLWYIHFIRLSVQLRNNTVIKLSHWGTNYTKLQAAVSF